MMRTAIAALTCLVAVQAWAGPLPPMPPPYGFMEVSSVLPNMREKALTGRPSGDRLIGFYMLTDEAAAMMQGTSIGMSVFCAAYVIYDGETENDARDVFQHLVTAARADSAKPYDMNDLTTHEVLRHYMDETRRRQGEDVSMIGATNLGSIIDKPDAFATSFVVNTSVETGRGRANSPMAGTGAYVLRGKQVLEMSDGVAFQGQASLTRVDQVEVDWVNSFLASHPD